MASQAQVNANRRNSQKSTGPKTVEGKAAVSQNAFKHGLFVNKAVVRDESQEEYDRHRETLLAEWNPVGPTETIVAERLVNLTWRLERAQRMQNQSIDCLGLDELAGFHAPNFKSLFREANGLSYHDLEIPDDHLLLGRMAVRDWSKYRVLDKMMLYERRIENSMYKTIKELERLQKARKAQDDRAVKGQAAKQNPPSRGHSGDLKKQSQFAAGAIVTNALNVKDYERMWRPEIEQNKAKQRQSDHEHVQDSLCSLSNLPSKGLIKT